MISLDFGFNQESSKGFLESMGYMASDSSGDLQDYGLTKVDTLGLLLSKLMLIAMFVVVIGSFLAATSLIH